MDQISTIKNYSLLRKVLTDNKLSIVAKTIYSYIYSLKLDNEKIPEVKIIINELQISENRFYKNKKQLIENGYLITETQRTGNRIIGLKYILLGLEDSPLP